jgi:hypothetical protein
VAVKDDLPSLLSFPLRQLIMYHGVPDTMVGARVKNSAKGSKVLNVSLQFINFPPAGGWQ